MKLQRQLQPMTLCSSIPLFLPERHQQPSPSLLGPTSYYRYGFTAADQEGLAATALSLTKRNVRVMLSNSDVPLVRELYSDPHFQLIEIQARRNINSRADGLGPISEMLITNF